MSRRHRRADPAWGRPPLRSQAQDLSGLRDPCGIAAELQRISRDLATDPAGAIGSAKQTRQAGPAGESIGQRRGVRPGGAMRAFAATRSRSSSIPTASSRSC
ncbi:hypothetical protein P3T35_007296 [Kitasatospora sp. GP30]|nr:hypothetical protein [Kitasatospora sp. GP30]